jgi:hypothetical protein
MRSVKIKYLLTKSGKICSVKKTRSVKMENPLSRNEKISSVKMENPLSNNEKTAWFK